MLNKTSSQSIHLQNYTKQRYTEYKTVDDNGYFHKNVLQYTLYNNYTENLIQG